MQTSRPDDRILALFLAAIVGCVDAVAFIELSGFFASAMGADTTRLGIAIGQRQWATAGFAFGLVALFVGGVAAGRLISRRFGARRVPVLLTILGVLLAAAASLYARGGYAHAPPLLALAMGLANVVIVREGAPALAIGSMTATLVRIGNALTEPGQRGALHDSSLWLAFVAGAFGGAAGEGRMGGTVLEIPAIAAIVLALWRWVRH